MISHTIIGLVFTSNIYNIYLLITTLGVHLLVNNFGEYFKVCGWTDDNNYRLTESEVVLYRFSPNFDSRYPKKLTRHHRHLLCSTPQLLYVNCIPRSGSDRSILETLMALPE